MATIWAPEKSVYGEIHTRFFVCLTAHDTNAALPNLDTIHSTNGRAAFHFLFQGRNFIFDFSTNPYPSPNFIFSTKPNPNKKSDFRRSYIQSSQLGSSSSIGIISHSSSVIGGRFRTSSSYSFCGIYKTSKFTTNSLV